MANANLVSVPIALVKECQENVCPGLTVLKESAPATKTISLIRVSVHGEKMSQNHAVTFQKSVWTMQSAKIVNVNVMMDSLTTMVYVVGSKM